MIRTLYETHLEVTDLDRSIAFYEKLGLKLAQRFDRMAFFWIGEVDREMMLGLWLVKDRPIAIRHFAFGVDLDFLLGSIEWLAERDIKPTEAFGREPVEPIVHAWMAGASIYFPDPDENELEFLSLLGDDPRLDLPQTPYYSEWVAMNAKQQA